MGAYGGPNIADEGLIFAYDTGNGKSYTGEPTENLASNANFSNGTTNWNGNQNVTLSVETINGTRFLKTKSNQTNSTPGLKSANISVTGNTTYTLTIRAYKNDSRTALMYATGNGTGGADIVWSTSALNGPNPITTELTTISRTFTTPSDMTYIQIGFLWSAPLTTSEVYIEYVQLEQKSHATPFVNGTRSATEGLKDLAGNASIDLSNVSFDSNAMLDFDGTSDYIAFSDNIYDVADEGTISELTISAWVNWNQFCASSTFDEIISWWQGGANTYLDGFLGTSKYTVIGDSAANPGIRFGDGWTNTGYNFTAATDVNKWWNIVGVKTADNAYLYVNGQLEATKGSALSWGFNGVATIGKHSSGGTEYLDGKIGNIKLYNRALSAQEVLEGFNGLKSRFGL